MGKTDKIMSLSGKVLIKEIRVGGNEVVIKNRGFKSGSINMFNSKKHKVVFDDSFDKPPQIGLTLMDTSTINPYVTNGNRDSFTINFQNIFTGTITWTAFER